MEKYVILADVTCDLSKELRDFCGMEDYLKGHVHISSGGEERELLTELDWTEISREEFYKLLGNKHAKVSTAPPNLDEYREAFERYAKDGYKIISMSISSKISSTYDFAKTAAARAKETYPDAEIYCFDSLRMSGAFALLTFYAHLLKKEGKSYAEVIEWLEENKSRVHQMGPIDDLMVIARRGRLTMGKAIMGSFAGVKPMGDCNEDGYVTVLTKAKGIRKALELTVEYVSETAVDPENCYAIVSHTDREQYAEALKNLLIEKMNFKDVFVTCSFSANGTNIGPGMIGVYYFGNAITDLSAEKATMAKITGK